MTTVRVRDYTITPGGRDIASGDDSAEWFLEKSNIIGICQKVIKDNSGIVEIDLDGTDGYPAAWLHHVFASLSMKLGRINVHSCLVIKTTEQPRLANDVWYYIDSCPDY